MARRIYIGDKVRTPHGDGIVHRVVTWRDKIVEMHHDFEAIEFSDRCRREVGLNFKEDWSKVTVAVNNKLRTYQSSQIEVLEGRDAGTGEP